jgi:hypothetical protein
MNIYCYADESGQDTKGKLFIVSAIIIDQDRDRFIQTCKRIEEQTGKKNAKWIRTAYPKRLDYIQRVLNAPLFFGRLTFAIYRNTNDYLALTIETIAHALKRTQTIHTKAIVLIDALPKKHETLVSRGLRTYGIRTRKVKGYAKMNMIRLSD